MSEPEVLTEGESDIGPPQFTIMSLVILTAAVAVFFALLTQAPEFLVLYLFFPAGVWLFPKHWRGIFAAVLCIYLGEVLIMFSRLPYFGAIRLIVVSLLASLVSGLYAASSTNRFDKAVGAICCYGSIILFLIISSIR